MTIMEYKILKIVLQREYGLPENGNMWDSNRSKEKRCF